MLSTIILSSYEFYPAVCLGSMTILSVLPNDLKRDFATLSILVAISL